MHVSDLLVRTGCMAIIKGSRSKHPWANSHTETTTEGKELPPSCTLLLENPQVPSAITPTRVTASIVALLSRHTPREACTHTLPYVTCPCGAGVSEILTPTNSSPTEQCITCTSAGHSQTHGGSIAADTADAAQARLFICGMCYGVFGGHGLVYCYNGYSHCDMSGTS
jgi:hypothetical protein